LGLALVLSADMVYTFLVTYMFLTFLHQNYFMFTRSLVQITIGDCLHCKLLYWQAGYKPLKNTLNKVFLTRWHGQPRICNYKCNKQSAKI